jgi:hypothetical protein
MTTAKRAALLLAFMLVPTVARADGFIDWLEKWSGPKLWGIGADLHLLCATKDGKALPLCERLVFLNQTRGDDLRHIVDLRIVGYWKRDGKRFDDDPDEGPLKAQRLQLFYRYRAARAVDVGAGLGFVRVSGDDFNAFTRGIVTPVSVAVYPAVLGHPTLRGFSLRAEETYITTGFSPGDFNNKTTFNSNGGEWNFSLALVYDFTRLR